MPQVKGPFRRWVPKWLAITACVIVSAPIMMINSEFSGGSIEIAGVLGTISENMTLVYFVTSAGMAIAYPLRKYMNDIITSKTLLLIGLIVQVLLSLLCVWSDEIAVLAVCSFFIGIFKGLVFLELFILLMPLMSPNNIRVDFYSKLYPMTLGFGQLSLITTAQLSYTYDWRYMFYLLIILLILAIVMVLICFRYAQRPLRFPYDQVDWWSVLLFSIFLITAVYVCIFGKTEDWFNSKKIVMGSIVMLLSGILAFRRQLILKDPYVSMSVFKNSSSVIGYIFMFLMMVMLGASSLFTAYVISVLKMDSLHANFLYIWMLPGFLIASIFCLWWFKKRYPLKGIILLGFLSYGIYIALLYFTIQPQGLYEDLYIPMMLRAVSMFCLYVTFGVYVIQGLTQSQFLDNAFFVVSIRSALGPAVGTMLFSNLLYHFQQKYMMILSEDINLQQSIPESQYQQSLQNALANGHSMTDAMILATNHLYTQVQMQSTLLSVKVILGYMLIVWIVVFIACLWLPFKYDIGDVKKGSVVT